MRARTWALLGLMLLVGNGCSNNGRRATFIPPPDMVALDMTLVFGQGGDMAQPPQIQDLAMEPAYVDMASPRSCPSEGIGNGDTGEPCTRNADCSPGFGPNQSAVCTKSVMQQGGGTTVWPSGYCTTPCRTAKNDPNNNGLNGDCPGGNATCADTGGATGSCVTACQTAQDCRNCYGCFVVNDVAPTGCEPLSLSQCDPNVARSCPQDVSPETCINVGDGTVGSCVPRCNPFNNTGCPGGMDAVDCHCSDLTGEGLCTYANGNGASAGSQCGNFYNDCPGGYGCLNGSCWKYCNDANVGQQCSQGATCMAFPRAKVATRIAGICSSSD